MSGEEASGRGNKGVVGFGDEGKHEVVDDSHNMSSRQFFEAGSIFKQGYIPAIMQAVFDLAVGSEHK